MKTTVHISDGLLAEAQAVARHDRTTLKALIQEGLRKVVDERKRHRPFQLRDVSFGEGGLQPDMAEAGWNQIRDKIYEGRGG